MSEKKRDAECMDRLYDDNVRFMLCEQCGILAGVIADCVSRCPGCGGAFGEVNTEDMVRKMFGIKDLTRLIIEEKQNEGCGCRKQKGKEDGIPG